jgi:aryl-alcohol dehydrogenase-like predicted oxidoreductase
MRYVNLGGVHISTIGLGTWQFGAREWVMETNTRRTWRRRSSLELGINLIDNPKPATASPARTATRSEDLAVTWMRTIPMQITSPRLRSRLVRMQAP